MNGSAMHRRRIWAAAVSIALLAAIGSSVASNIEVTTVYYGPDGAIVGEHQRRCDGTVFSWGVRGTSYERFTRPCD